MIQFQNSCSLISFKFIHLFPVVEGKIRDYFFLNSCLNYVLNWDKRQWSLHWDRKALDGKTWENILGMFLDIRVSFKENMKEKIFCFLNIC